MPISRDDMDALKELSVNEFISRYSAVAFIRNETGTTLIRACEIFEEALVEYPNAPLSRAVNKARKEREDEKNNRWWDKLFGTIDQ